MKTDMTKILDNLLEGFQLIGFDWKYLYVNDAVVKQSRYASSDDLLGYTMMEKYPGIENSKMFEILNTCMTQRVSASFENQFTYPDGKLGWFELRMEPVPEGVVILSIDISERKKLDMDKKEYCKALEEMLFMTSHEVRQPVANCLGLVDVLENHDPALDELLKILSHIKESAGVLDLFTKKLTNFMNDLKEKNKIETWD